jgi:O-succinylbenzoic acid--CoA ligase
VNLFAAAREAPGRVAVVAGGVEHTYADLAARARRALGALPPAERVAFVAHPRLEELVLLHALIARGSEVVPLHPRLTGGERARLVELARPSLVIADAAAYLDGPPAPDPPPAGDARPLATVFTSGSSGRPKGVVLSRRAFRASAAASAANLGWRDDDRWLLALPFAHIGGLSVIVRALLARRAVVLGELAGAARDGVTLVSLVPAQVARLLDDDWDPPPRLRAILVGGAAAAPALLARAADRGWPLLTTYGLTEACSQVATQRPGTMNRGQLGAGRPLIPLRVVDGEIRVRGETLLDRFADGPAPLDDGGWLRTGDRGLLDGDGNLHVLGRRDDLIVTGGENVDPLEVEQALEAHPAIAAACVVGVPDPTWGQLVAAVLVARGAAPPAEAELAAHLAARLARFKQPRRWTWVAELPRTPSGKLDRAGAGALIAPWPA